jgi:hypothetical protein
MPTTLVEKLIMRPPSRISLVASRMVLKLPFRLMSIIRAKAASSVSARLASDMTPALLTSTSTPPNAATDSANRRRTSPGWLTSALHTAARPPASLILRASASAGPVLAA